jgi:hypothetical protein
MDTAIPANCRGSQNHWKNRRKVTLTRQSQLILLKPLKIVLRSSYDGVPLKFKNKKGSGPVYQVILFEPELDPSKNSLDNTFKRGSKVGSVEKSSPNVKINFFLKDPHSINLQNNVLMA